MTLPAKNIAHCTTVSFSRPVFSCIVTAKLYIEGLLNLRQRWTDSPFLQFTIHLDSQVQYDDSTQLNSFLGEFKGDSIPDSK